MATLFPCGTGTVLWALSTCTWEGAQANTQPWCPSIKGWMCPCHDLKTNQFALLCTTTASTCSALPSAPRGLTNLGEVIMWSSKIPTVLSVLFLWICSDSFYLVSWHFLIVCLALTVSTFHWYVMPLWLEWSPFLSYSINKKTRTNTCDNLHLLQDPPLYCKTAEQTEGCKMCFVRGGKRERVGLVWGFFASCLSFGF